MAIVVYKCDTCKRDVELLRNIEGLETPGRCVITLGCRGRLYQTKVHPDFTRAALPADVLGLDNWLQRKVLHNHEQTIETDQWTVTHELGTFPAISVFVDRPTTEDPENREEILPQDVRIVDSDTLILVFDRAYSGVAQLVARASDPQLLQPNNSTASESEPDPVQISTNAYVTLATRIDKFGIDPVINLKLRYRTNAGVEFTVTYPATLNIAEGTPWSDAERILFKGKVYLVRQFNGITTEITTGAIVNGTAFRFYSFDINNDLVDDYVVDPDDQSGSPLPAIIQSNDMIILTANSPFGTVDKILNTYIDITAVTTSKNTHGLFYNGNEFFAAPSIIQNVYPPIRIV
jgi:hypothetical protein